MRRLPLVAAMLAVVLFAAPAISQEAPSRPDGYKFGNPRLLTQQLIWGLVHGVRLLANACRAEETGGPVAQAYADWLDRHKDRIQSAARDLSRHYFGQDTVPFETLTAALHLKPELDLPPDDLAPACASFVQVVGAPRYDLELFYVLRRDAARVERAEAVRVRVASCLKKLAAEPAASLEANFSAWARTNELVENVSRSRLFTHKGDSPEDRQWRRDAGAGAIPLAVDCEQLANALAEPAYALRDPFDDSSR